MPSVAALAVVIAVVVAYLLYTRYPEATRRWFQRINMTRRVLWTLFLIGIVVVLLQSGMLSFIILGAIVAGYAVLYILYERPHEAVRNALGV